MTTYGSEKIPLAKFIPEDTANKDILVWLVWAQRPHLAMDLDLRAICTSETSAKQYSKAIRREFFEERTKVWIEPRELEHMYGHCMIEALQEGAGEVKKKLGILEEDRRVKGRRCTAPSKIKDECPNYLDGGNCVHFGSCDYLEKDKRYRCPKCGDKMNLIEDKGRELHQCRGCLSKFSIEEEKI